MKEISSINNAVQSSMNRTYLESKKVDKEQEDSSKKIASGKKNEETGSDSASLAISAALISQMNGTAQASRNAQDGISLVQTASGGLSATSDMLQRARELTLQSANGIYSDSQKNMINQELNQISEAIVDVSKTTQFNGQNLLDGSSSELTLQTGANAGDQTILDLSSSDISGLNTAGGFDLSTMSTDDILNAIDADLESVASGQAELGAYSNGLSSTINSLEDYNVSISAANSQISDTDMAEEMMNLNKSNIIKAAQMNMLMQESTQMINAMNILA